MDTVHKLESMASCDPLLLMPANKLSKMIKEGCLTSTRLCQVYIERIKRVQPKINCMAEDRFEAALEEAGQIDQLVAKYRQAGPDVELNSSSSSSSKEFTREQLQMLESPLLGIPVSVKESIQVKGMTNSCGVWERRQVRASEDAVVVANLRAHGLIPICTTNVPELTLFWADCNNTIYGRARNPYNQGRVTGASSGGEGGLIAAAGSLLGIGSDIGGSLRSPGHYCGVFAHKASPFLVSAEGNFPALKEARLRLFTIGPMCRYASDLRHLLRLIMSDVSNAKRDTYLVHQPDNIGQMRETVLKLLDEPASSSIDLSQVKLFYCEFNKINKLRALITQREAGVQAELMQAQREVIDHFVAKYNCQTEHIDLSKYLDNMFAIWCSMIVCGATKDYEQAFENDEVKKLFGIENNALEIIKWLLGASNHTKEALLTIQFGLTTPTSRERAHKYCEKFEKIAQNMREEMVAKLGSNGVIIMPTLPTVAHRHHYSIIKTEQARFPSIFNVLQFPATHAPIRLDRKRKLPFGVTIASRPYNDHITIAMAEEIESAFGGWTLPTKLTPAAAVATPAAPTGPTLASSKSAKNKSEAKNSVVCGDGGGGGNHQETSDNKPEMVREKSQQNHHGHLMEAEVLQT